MVARPSIWRWWPVLLTLVVTVATTVLGVRYLSESAATIERQHFEDAVSAMESAVAERIETYLQVLDAVAGLFSARDPSSIGPAVFDAFVKRVVPYSERHAADSYGWIALDPAAPIDGDKPIVGVTYSVTRGHSAWHAGGRHMLADPVLREALERASRVGHAAASEPIVLRDTGEPGFFLFDTVYRPGTPSPGVSHPSVTGFVFARFRARDLFGGTFSRASGPRVGFAVYDANVSGDRSRMYASPGFDPDAASLERTLHVGGREWRLVFTRPPGTLGTSHTALVTFAAAIGLVVSLVLVLVVAVQTRARWQATALASELALSREQLRRANEAKDEFLAMLGHELRNPLGAMRAGLEVLRDEGAARSDGGESALAAVERQLQQQTRLVDDLLDVSRVSRGKIVLRIETIDLRDVARAAADTLRSAVANKDQELVVDLPPRPVAVDGDRTRLEQVAQNLLRNAVKYTPPGGHLRITVASRDGRAELRVSDDGIGIEPEAQAQVFDLFTQVGATIDRADGGLGIGLTLSKRIVDLHEGTIEVASEGRDRGTEVTVRLRLSDRSPERRVTLHAEPPLDAPSLHVLLVEDHEDARVLTARLLRRWGHRVSIAENGEEAVRLARAEHPDVALVDIGLPGLSGYDVARELRRDLSSDELVLIALSGYGRDSDRRESARAGFDQHMVKPFEPEALRETLAAAAAARH